jgi:hypothetical protein
MNQIDLILENIRLGHINQLMLEATTPAEVNRGVALINESIQQVYSVLQEANFNPAGAALGVAGGAALGAAGGALASVPDSIIRTVGGTIGDDDGTSGFGQQLYDGAAGLGTLGAIGGGLAGGISGATLGNRTR